MKNFIVAIALSLALASCGEYPTTVRNRQAEVASAAAQKIDFSGGNAEVQNIQRRGQMVADPGLTGYAVLLSFGRPVAYYTVKGKITSSGKRLEVPQSANCETTNIIPCGTITDAPSYDGTYGSSDPYIFFWTVEGQYIQWGTTGGGNYLYSDKPLNPNGAAAAAVIE